jgi:hypothetical protein
MVWESFEAMGCALSETARWQKRLRRQPLVLTGVLFSLYYVQWRYGVVPDDPDEAESLCLRQSDDAEERATFHRLWPAVRRFFDETPAPGLMRSRDVETARAWAVRVLEARTEESET